MFSGEKCNWYRHLLNVKIANKFLKFFHSICDVFSFQESIFNKILTDKKDSAV